MKINLFSFLAKISAIQKKKGRGVGGRRKEYKEYEESVREEVTA